MIKDLILEFVDWRAAYLTKRAKRCLELARWWTDLADAIDNDEPLAEVRARREHDEGRRP